MFYKKIETYQFSTSSEFKAYLDFKQQLSDSGITFTEEGGSMFQTIKIITSGRFDRTEEVGNVDKNRT